MEANAVEICSRLVEESLKGVQQAQAVLQCLGEGPLSPESLANAWGRWNSAASPTAGGKEQGDFQKIVEDWWEAIGVVPRYKYQGLLERYEELKGRLEAAEQTVAQLKALLAVRGAEKEALATLEAWGDVTQKALERQEEWFRAWMAGPAAPKPHR